MKLAIALVSDIQIIKEEIAADQVQVNQQVLLELFTSQEHQQVLAEAMTHG